MLDPELQKFVEKNRANGFTYEQIKDEFVRGNYCTAEEFDEYLASQSGRLPREILIVVVLMVLMISSLFYLFVKIDSVQNVLEEEIDTLNTAVQEIAQSSKDYTDQRTSELQADVEQRATDLQSGIDTVNARQNQSEKQVADIVSNVSRKFNETAQEFQTIQGNLSFIQQEVESVQQELSSFQTATNKTLPAIVKITVEFEDSFLESLGVEPKQFGTGFIADADGTIITNKHVINATTFFGGQATITSMTVETHDGTLFTPTIIGRDDTIDLAVLEITSNANFSFINFSDRELITGEEVFTLGNPDGLDFSFSAGFISNPKRVLYDNNGLIQFEPPGTEFSYIQLNMGVNTGNSGGPLITKEGTVAGVVTLSSLSSQGIGFALPVEDVRRVYDRFT